MFVWHCHISVFVHKSLPVQNKRDEKFNKKKLSCLFASLFFRPQWNFAEVQQLWPIHEPKLRNQYKNECVSHDELKNIN